MNLKMGVLREDRILHQPQASPSCVPICLHVVVRESVSGWLHPCRTLCLIVRGIDCSCGRSVPYSPMYVS